MPAIGSAMHRNRLLFVSKHRHYHHHWNEPSAPGHLGSPKPLSSGLQNSVSFVVDMLNGLGIEAAHVEVVDANSIDREVTLYQPTHVFLEAFWCPPAKIDQLQPLHPRVQWIVRNHSETPFLSNEGIALEWIAGYLARGVEINCNSVRAYREMKVVAHTFGASGNLVTYLPNFYPVPGHDSTIPRPQVENGAVHIGCFGAIRPLKNQLQQAVAAIAFADNERMRLRFHINGSRIEGKGDPILKNLRALFVGAKWHRLVEHPWSSHPDFLGIMAGMDMAMQVSFSETFNIVSADAVKMAVPVVASREVSWLGDYAMAAPDDARSIVRALTAAWNDSQHGRLYRQRRDLAQFCDDSENLWGERFSQE